MYHQIALNRRKSVLVIALFFLVWIGVGYGIGLLAGHLQTSGGVTGAIIAGFLALLAVLWALSMGQLTVLAVSHARPAAQQQYPQLYDIVSTLTIGSGLPMPRIYVIEDPSPNAFATGMSPKSAAITVTSGLLQIMNREELEGVLAHEMSHIRNYDVRLVLIVATVVSLAGLLASILWRSMFYQRWGGNNRDSGNAVIVLLAAAVVLTIIAAIVGPIMQFALSRDRESLADASSVELTRNPAGLLHALQKLAQNDKPFAGMNHVTASMCIDDPLEHHHAWFHHLFDTHPPIQERIAALQKMLNVEQT